MTTYTIAFLLACICTLLLTPIVRTQSFRMGWVDDPSEARKVHKVAVPRTGGIAIAAGFFAPILGLYFVENQISTAYLHSMRQVAGLILGALAMVALGLADDVWNLRARYKFFIQIIVAVFAFSMGYQINFVANPFGDPIALGMLSLPVTLLWIIGVSNAINLIDGLDGLAGGVSFFTVLTMFGVAILLGNPIAGLTSAALAGALIGFLRYNFNPASIFMGDSGSLFLGYTIAVTAISSATKSPTLVALLVPILALGVPIIDTSLAVFRRFLGGRPVFSADRHHIHHKLLDMGLTTRQAVVAIYALAALQGIGALMLVNATSTRAAIVLLAFGTSTIFLSRSLGYLHWGRLSQSIRYGLRRQQLLRNHLDLTQQFLEKAVELQDRQALNDTLVELVTALDVDICEIEADLEIPSRARESLHLRHPRNPEAPSRTVSLSKLVYPLDWRLGDARITGHILFAWHVGEEFMQLPDAPCYALIASTYRDTILRVSTQPQSSNRPEAVRVANMTPAAQGAGSRQN